MKRIATILILLFVLSVSVFADEGDVPMGGKTCPPGQTCLTDGGVPTGGKIDGTTHTGGRSENPIYQDIFDFLKSIFE